jgi:pilus assembly protein Flp/PilA
MFEKLQFLAIMFTSDLRAKRDERGATAVEYGMLVALIAAVIVTIVATLGTQVGNAFQTISDALPAA